MDVEKEIFIVLKLLIAFVLGAAIGLDREKHGSSAGIRTYAAVCLGATLFTAIGEHLQDIAAASRIIANILVGIGFLGAGIIYKNDKTNSSQGLTTAATIWCTAGIGVAVGLNMLIIAVVAAAAIYFLLSLYHHKWYLRWKAKMQKAHKIENTDD
ncbi:membrane protein [Pedobacter antarcticus 4BY]|uniref:Membrane protein n=2 Tax=Pedobacter antarcticus TaxID=34086 RepID=A0A081PFV4_9SPHI|nr:MgtC/SapB family protein [Pedobacter antarcticus]KEQ29577.1 membrane protein [Pedobacter antarcticus 4BY]SFF43930.1 putative Mg2+ transporter-C (MgtC) family protein [Pedobacter antarcticus]